MKAMPRKIFFTPPPNHKSVPTALGGILIWINLIRDYQVDMHTQFEENPYSCFYEEIKNDIEFYSDT